MYAQRILCAIFTIYVWRQAYPDRASRSPPPGGTVGYAGRFLRNKGSAGAREQLLCLPQRQAEDGWPRSFLRRRVPPRTRQRSAHIRKGTGTKQVATGAELSGRDQDAAHGQIIGPADCRYNRLGEDGRALAQHSLAGRGAEDLRLPIHRRAARLLVFSAGERLSCTCGEEWGLAEEPDRQFHPREIGRKAS